MMEEKSLKKLEFDKICQMLAQRASSRMGKELATALVPETDLWVIERLQDETEEGFQMLVRQGEPPFGGIRDIRELLQRSSVGGLLSMGELLMVADTARSIRQIKNFGKEKKIRRHAPDWIHCSQDYPVIRIWRKRSSDASCQRKIWMIMPVRHWPVFANR